MILNSLSSLMSYCPSLHLARSLPKEPPRPDFREECLAGVEIRAASGDGGHGVITALHPQRGSVSWVPTVCRLCAGFGASVKKNSRRGAGRLFLGVNRHGEGRFEGFR